MRNPFRYFKTSPEIIGLAVIQHPLLHNYPLTRARHAGDQAILRARESELIGGFFKARCQA